MVKINQNFSNFKKEFPDWKKQFSVYKRDDDLFQRIPCVGVENKLLVHQFHVCINVKTGDLYLDCRRRKIFAKHVTLLFFRPLHTLFKTIWHISIIAPFIFEARKVKNGTQTKKEFLQNNVKSLADIVRTPLYGTAMTITHLAAIVLGIINPNSLYKTRAIIGKMERKMLRVDYVGAVKCQVSGLSFCFSPFNNMGRIYFEEKKPHAKADEIKDAILERFAKMSVSYVKFRRKGMSAFNDCYAEYPEGKAFISAAKPKEVEPSS